MASVASSSTLTWAGLSKTLGPGFLFAGAAIGGSHLVQSTQAGAFYGWTLIWAIIAANLFKYPFFEFVYRYMDATGEDMLQGYQRVGRWALWLALLIILGGAVLSYGGVVLITASLAQVLFGNPFPEPYAMIGWASVIAITCMLLVMIGRYPLLDRLMKIIVSALALTTLVAFILALASGGTIERVERASFAFDAVGLAILLALMGWMPAPIDVGIWPSLWAKERRRQTGHQSTRPESNIDFHIGYLSSAITAFFFLGLGALIMYGAGEEPSRSGPVFARQLINLYVSTIGDWAFYFVGAAVFATMFSTTLTCIDGWPRTLQRGFQLALRRNQDEKHPRSSRAYWFFIVFLTAVALSVIGFFITSMGQLVQIATIIAFLSAPVMAALHLLVMRLPNIPEVFRPPIWLAVLSWVGIAFLAVFSASFLYVLLG